METINTRNMETNELENELSTSKQDLISETVKIDINKETSDLKTIESGKYAATNLLTDSNTIMCRICFSQDAINNFISPCLCKGSVAFVHKTCLERWLCRSGTSQCDLCSYELNTESRLKYGAYEAISIWASHRNTRRLFRYDVISFILLNILTILLITIIVHGFKILLNNYPDESVFKDLNFGFLVVCSVFLLAIYSISMSILINTQIYPWYKWWQSIRVVKLK